jgi:hypothetical protein
MNAGVRAVRCNIDIIVRISTGRDISDAPIQRMIVLIAQNTSLSPILQHDARLMIDRVFPARTDLLVTS